MENFAPECPKWGMENAMFNLHGWTNKRYWIQIKIITGGGGGFKGSKHAYETRIAKKNGGPIYLKGCMFSRKANPVLDEAEV
jgi:hypothetical protein